MGSRRRARFPTKSYSKVAGGDETELIDVRLGFAAILRCAAGSGSCMMRMRL